LVNAGFTGRDPKQCCPCYGFGNRLLLRIDVDLFQYGGILRKVERVGLGEEVDADEEEG
jgi:hypothetical protein